MTEELTSPEFAKEFRRAKIRERIKNVFEKGDPTWGSFTTELSPHGIGTVVGQLLYEMEDLIEDFKDQEEGRTVFLGELRKALQENCDNAVNGVRKVSGDKEVAKQIEPVERLKTNLDSLIISFIYGKGRKEEHRTI